MNMKILIIPVLIAIALTGCGSDKNKNNDADSLMTDSTVIDSAAGNVTPVDTAVSGRDTTSVDTTPVVH